MKKVLEKILFRILCGIEFIHDNWVAILLCSILVVFLWCSKEGAKLEEERQEHEKIYKQACESRGGFVFKSEQEFYCLDKSLQK